jgi:ubiquitin-conjugating enzyme E2 Z
MTSVTSELQPKPINVLSLYAKKRIFKDTKDILKDPLTSMGIYYKNDEDDLSLGYALIIGPDDTPYQYGYYLFEFKYPSNYPFYPPVVTYLSNDGVVRYNPNLYRNGKVCLSLLNTWDGPSWKPCQTLRSVLISILSNVFVKNPLCNEPGYNERSSENIPYTEIIRFKNIGFSCISIYLKTKKINHKAYNVFYDTIYSHFTENYENINKYALQCCDIFNSNKKYLIDMNLYNTRSCSLWFSIYNINVVIRYEDVIQDLIDINSGKLKPNTTNAIIT